MIILFVLMPIISGGMAIFGYYALKGEYSDDKISAYQTLYTCLEVVAKLSAPIAPFFMDQLYQDLNKVTGKETAESIHLTDFPVADESLIDQDLVEKTHLAQNITSMVFSLRKKENVKVRQPLQKVLVPVLDSKTEEQILAVAELIKQEVNVKELQLINAEEASHLIVKQIKPNFKALGPKLGKDMKVVGAEISNLTAEQISANSWAGQYSNINASTDKQYTFSSSVATDYITITNADGTVVYATGVTPLTWSSLPQS